MTLSIAHHDALDHPVGSKKKEKKIAATLSIAQKTKKKNRSPPHALDALNRPQKRKKRKDHRHDTLDPRSCSRFLKRKKRKDRRDALDRPQKRKDRPEAPLVGSNK
jgi:hypothetical protein